MTDISIIDKLSLLFKTIIKSPYLITTVIIGIIIAAFAVFQIVSSRKINPILFIVGWCFVGAFIIIKYWSYLNELGDNLINNVFMAIYFPNLAVYIILFLVVNFIFIFSIFNRKQRKTNRTINIIMALIFDLLFVVIVDVLATKNIDIYSKLDVYSDKTLLALIELSTALCIIWLLVFLTIKFYMMYKKIDVKQKEPELIVKNPNVMTVDAEEVTDVEPMWSTFSNKIEDVNMVNLEVKTEEDEVKEEKILPSVVENYDLSSSKVITWKQKKFQVFNLSKDLVRKRTEFGHNLANDKIIKRSNFYTLTKDETLKRCDFRHTLSNDKTVKRSKFHNSLISDNVVKHKIIKLNA